jgi:hypothetical protein
MAVTCFYEIQHNRGLWGKINVSFNQKNDRWDVTLWNIDSIPRVWQLLDIHISNLVLGRDLYILRNCEWLGIIMLSTDSILGVQLSARHPTF